MKITVEFNSLEEINEFASKVWVGGLEPQKIEEKAQAIEEKKPKKATKKEEPKEEAPAEDPEELPFKEDAEEEKAPAEEKAPEVDTSKLKVEVRKLLTKVNKQTGKNQAKEWIKNLGHDSLTDVEDLDDLNALKALAEEELNA